MREKPILFSGAMVNAILDGRKSATRRAIKPQPQNVDNARAPWAKDDLLWVRETFTGDWRGNGQPSPGCINYRADGEIPQEYGENYWRPSIFMPRWASRITLCVTGVRAERLQEISNADICAELGCAAQWPGPDPEPYRRNLRSAFCGLWDSINSKRGYAWDSDPWVWVVTFERTKGTS